MLNTLFIMRSRWQEVLLIVGLQTAGGFAFMQVIQSRENNTGGSEVLPFAILLFVTFSVVAKILSLGFARTSFTDGPMHYEPWTLLKVGYHYFWRVIGFELLIAMITLSIIIGLYMILTMAGTVPEKANEEQVARISLYCAIIAMLLVAKPMVLGPAAIMVTDCGIFGAFGWLTWLKIFRALKSLIAYILWLAIVLGPNLISALGGRAFVEHYATMVAFSVAAGLLTLIIYVTAVKAVSDVYLPSQLSENGFGTETKEDVPLD